MYEEHIALIRKKDMDSLLHQYAEDALLISSFSREPQYFRGRDELRVHFKGLLDNIVGLTSDIAFWAETENPQTLMIVEAVTLQFPSGNQNMRFADSWVLRDGKIAIHFAGMVQYPDGSLA
jgi:ketosteroid isomerase-like protein